MDILLTDSRSHDTRLTALEERDTQQALVDKSMLVQAVESGESAPEGEERPADPYDKMMTAKDARIMTLEVQLETCKRDGAVKVLREAVEEIGNLEIGFDVDGPIRTFKSRVYAILDAKIDAPDGKDSNE